MKVCSQIAHLVAITHPTTYMNFVTCQAKGEEEDWHLPLLRIPNHPFIIAPL